MDIIQELEHVAHFSREEGRIPDAERLEAVLKVLRALLQNAEPVARIISQSEYKNTKFATVVLKEFLAAGAELFTHPPKDSTETTKEKL